MTPLPFLLFLSLHSFCPLVTPFPTQVPEKRLYILSCSNTRLSTLIIPSEEGERTERDLQRTDWGRACRGCVWMMGFVQAGRLSEVLWRSRREEVSVRLVLGSTCSAGLGDECSESGEKSGGESRFQGRLHEGGGV